MAESEITTLSDIDEAVEHLRREIGTGDIVLIKGSRGLRMDKIVSDLEVLD